MAQVCCWLGYYFEQVFPFYFLTPQLIMASLDQGHGCNIQLIVSLSLLYVVNLFIFAGDMELIIL